MPFSIVATIVAQPDHRDAVLDALSAMLAPTRAEAGCRQYDLHVDHADPNRLVMIERWDSQAALDAHIASPHMARLKAAIAEKTSGIDVVQLDPVA